MNSDFVPYQINEPLARLMEQPRSEFWNYNVLGIAHEIRNPLSVIETSIEFIFDHPYFDRSQIKDYLELVQRNIERIRVCMDELLDLLTKGGANGGLRLEWVDIVETCSKVTMRYKPQMDMKSIAFHFQCDPPSLLVLCDPNKFEMIVSNLLSNAVKYTESGFIRLSVYQRGNLAYVEVEDSGKGIANEDLPFVFDGFFQVNAKKNNGGGLGLTLSKTFAKAHGGTIEVYSDGLGKGSRFLLRLPKISREYP